MTTKNLTTAIAYNLKQARAMTAGDALRRTHYSQAMGGSQFRTLMTYLYELQNGQCALTGERIRMARTRDYDAATFHTLVPSALWGDDTARATTTASNGKSLDPYRLGFVPGNVVLAGYAASHAVRSIVARPQWLTINDDSFAHVWIPDMTRAAKVKSPDARDSVRRQLAANGWPIA